jgi:hypothetical protein
MKTWGGIVIAAIAFAVTQDEVIKAGISNRHPAVNRTEFFFQQKKTAYTPVASATWTGTRDGRKIWYKFKPRAGSFVMAMSYDNKTWSVPPHQSWYDSHGHLTRITFDKRVETSENGGAQWTNVPDRSWTAEDGFRYRVDEAGKLWRKKG